MPRKSTVQMILSFLRINTRKPRRSTGQMIVSFLRTQASAGILLMVFALLAIVVANSPLRTLYEQFIHAQVIVSIGAFTIDKPALLWINDGMMALFFLLVGLEIKRAFLSGELSDRNARMLPLLAAAGGMAVPALIYAMFHLDDPIALHGWAIPAATDIAFALGILSLLGDRVPVSAKLFLLSVAIFDDLGAILIIALFYTSKISFIALLVSFAAFAVLVFMNRRGVSASSPYLLIGIIMWAALLKSGVHATLAGVMLAMCIPLESRQDPNVSPLRILEGDLQMAVTLLVLPLFAFVNSGISFQGADTEFFFHDVPVSIALALFFGKQLGVFGVSWLAIKAKIVELPQGINWQILYGVSLLCGVGFTMSLFIGALSFESVRAYAHFDERVGILFGSLVSGLVGYFVLRRALPKLPQSN